MKWNLIEKQTEFLDILKVQGKSFNTIKNYKADLACFNGFLVEKQDGLKFNQFTTAQVQEYAQYLQKKYDSSNSVRRRVQALRLFFDYLLSENIFEENPIKKMAVSPKILDVPRPQTFAEVLKVHVLLKKRVNQHENLAQFVHLRNLIIFHLIFGAGLKVSDLSSLKMESILKAKKGFRVMVEHPKRDPYSINLPDSFNADFFQYQELYEKFISNENLDIDELFFNANPYKILSGGLSPRGIELFFEDLRRETKMEITAKSLRQACIFKWLNLNCPHSSIKEWLGVAPSYSLELYVEELQKSPADFVYTEIEDEHA